MAATCAELSIASCAPFESRWKSDPPAAEAELSMQAAEMPWGVDSEYGRLLDVLLCRPDNYRWLPTSAISRSTLERGIEFDASRARSEHAELVSAYEEAG